MLDAIKILHSVGSLAPEHGGPSRTVPQLVSALGTVSGVRVSMMVGGCERSLPSASIHQDARMEEVLCTDIARSGRYWFRNNSASVQGRRLEIDCIHDHGLWQPFNHAIARLAAERKLPLIIQPRGMLEPWALRHKSLKKRLALALYQRRDLESATALVATSEEECKNLRTLGLKQPIALIPNGIPLEEYSMLTSVEKGSNRQVRTILYLSRIHPVKGLLNLVRAWASIRPNGWRLVIAGPDEGGYLAEVKEEVSRLDVAADMEFIGSVNGIEKANAYREADVFVLPTFSESFGVVVAEALAHGLPVITTRGAPWSDLQTYRCGWWIDIGVDPLEAALHEAMSLSDEERIAMGQRGRAYVRRYNWEDIASQTVQLYRWVLGRAGKPECVHLI